MSKILRVIDNTALSTSRQCHFEYWAGMVEHRRPRTTTAPLHYGTVMHTLLEIFYKTRDPFLAKVVAMKKYQGKEPWPDDHRTLERAIIVFEAWMDTYGYKDTRQDHTVGWPESPAVEITTQIMLPIAQIPYAVRIDRFVEIEGLLYVEDHKTTSSLGPQFFREFELSAQMMGYARVGSLLLNRRVHGVRINAICTLKTTHKFERQIIPFTEERLLDWERQTGVAYRELERRYEENSWPKSYNCTRRYGRCQYFDICTLPESLQLKALEQDFDRVPWDPLAQHDDD